jgi:hypothetical protein
LKTVRIILILCALSSTPDAIAQPLFINEFMASNSDAYMDPDFQDFPDWIELYNAADSAIDLSGYYLSDDLSDTTCWQIPAGTIIGPDSFLCFIADGRDTCLSCCHTNFKLQKSGEEIVLFTDVGILVDSIVYDFQQTDASFGRRPDGNFEWFYFEEPSFNSSNASTVFSRVPAVTFSLEAGFYNREQVLELSIEDPEAEIRYTLDGSEPTSVSQFYNGPINIKSRAGDPNLISMIRTNEDPYHWLPDWVAPEGEVFKATVVRARGFKKGSRPGNITTSTYFVDSLIHSRYPDIVVISLATDNANLFDYTTGIYVPGVTHIHGYNSTGNYFQDWEKPAHIEFFEPGGILGFSEDVGIRIQGGTSPASPQKGLHVIARNEYGNNRIDYPIFHASQSTAKDLTEYKRFIIRAWGSVITAGMFNDALAQNLLATNDLDIQAYCPAILFINGEYWGLHELREANKNSWYYQYHYGIDRDDPGFDILLHELRNGAPYASVDEGDADHWNEMMYYLRSYDLSLPEHYEYIGTQMDVDNFITYLGHCIFTGKWDWPNNNDASWRPRTEKGRWRWIQFDMETSFGVATGLGPEYASLGIDLNMVKAVTEGVDIPGFGKYGPHPVMEELMDNPSFRESFVAWFEHALDHEFLPDSTIGLLEEITAGLEPYMEEHLKRWPYIAGGLDGWKDQLDLIREFLLQRPYYVRQHLQEFANAGSTGIYLPQNSPNPFRDLTNFKYTLSIGADVVLAVYDVSGKLITVLVDEFQQAGLHTFTWYIPALSPGAYFYSLRTVNQVITKPMLKIE